MTGAERFVLDVFNIAFTVVMCLAVIGRFAVFAYWWVADAWTKEGTAEWVDGNNSEGK